MLRLRAPLACLVVLSACAEGDATTLLRRTAQLRDLPVLEGELEHRIASMLDGSERTSFHLRTADGVVEIVAPDEATAAAWTQIRYRTRVQVFGDAIDERSFAADELGVIAPPPEPLIDPSPRAHRRIATVLLQWAGAQGLGNEVAKNSMFIDPKSTNVFYGENSYGMEKIAGDVFGPYTIDKPVDCYSDQIAEAGLLAFIDKGHDPSEFIQFMWHFPGLNCGWSGLGVSGNVEFPGHDSWYNGNFGCVVRAQEIGHNYGLAHSHSYNCVDPEGAPTPLSDECQHVEYGDPFDPMGGGCAHMNVVQKSFMGWLEGCNIVTTASDGIYNVMATELPCAGTQALRFRSYRDDRHYYLEYRAPLGVDALNGVNGVLLHESNDFDYTPNVYILDVGNNGQMHTGDSYSDPQGVVSFTILEEHDTHAVVQVTFPDGGSGTPMCHDGSAPETVDGAVGSLECAAEPYPLDTTLPTVTITYPLDGDVFEPGSDLVIKAEAMDDRGITEAELYLDGEPVFKLFDPPYEWPITDLPMPEDGDFEFGVVVRDGPNMGLSQAVTIQVMDLPDATSTGGVDGTAGSEGPVESSGGGEASTGSGTSGAQSDDAQGCGCTSAGSGWGGWALVVVGWYRRRRVTAHARRR